VRSLVVHDATPEDAAEVLDPVLDDVGVDVEVVVEPEVDVGDEELETLEPDVGVVVPLELQPATATARAAIGITPAT
jgi:hypothetical protein